MKNNKGITLIALIITIIIMLILVATTVLMVVNSNLIGTAEGAKESTKQAYEDEKSYGMNVTIRNKNYVSVGDYGKPNGGNGGAGGDPEGEEPNGTIADDGTVIIDENGDKLLHVFGQKYQISNTTTWSELTTCVVPVTITASTDDNIYGCTVNGHGLVHIDYEWYYEMDFSIGGPDATWYETEINNAPIVNLLACDGR